MVQLLDSYNLQTIEELREYKPRTRDECRPIKHLVSYNSFYYLQLGCDFSIHYYLRIREYISTVYEIKVKEYEKSLLQKEYKLQTYFTRKGLIDYFIVIEGPSQSSRSKLDSTILIKTKKELFIKLEKDYEDTKGDIEEQASIVYNFGDSRSERVLQLERIDYLSHLASLVGGRRPAKRGGFASVRPTTATMIVTATLCTLIPGQVVIESVANRPLSRIVSLISRFPGRNLLETRSQGIPAQRGNYLYHVIRGVILEQ